MPFCGELPVERYTPSTDKLCDAAEVECMNRLCPVRPKTDALTYHNIAAERAAKHWNTRAAPVATLSGAQATADVVADAQFLIDLLDEFAPDEDAVRDFYGHVVPAKERLHGALQRLSLATPAPTQRSGEVRNALAMLVDCARSEHWPVLKDKLLADADKALAAHLEGSVPSRSTVEVARVVRDCVTTEGFEVGKAAAIIQQDGESMRVKALEEAAQLASTGGGFGSLPREIRALAEQPKESLDA